MKIGSREFSFGQKTYLMGILNVTPDSFSDGGRFLPKDRALFHAEKLIKDGADLLDIGGESTRPGYQEISSQEEMERIVPVIRAVKENFDIPVSVDTYKADVFLEAAGAGADLLNDIWGFRREASVESGKIGMVSKMALAAAKTGLPVCLMHNRKEAVYRDFPREIMEDLEKSLLTAENAGVKRESILLDPGIGFGKTYEQNLWCLKHLEEFKRFGLPILLGASRKSVIGLALDLPVAEREEGTIVTTVMAVLKGCAFVRVHNVQANKRAVRMAEAILRGGG